MENYFFHIYWPMRDMVSRSSNILDSGAIVSLIFWINSAQVSRYGEKTFWQQEDKAGQYQRRYLTSSRESQRKHQLPASRRGTKEFCSSSENFPVIGQPRMTRILTKLPKHELYEVKNDFSNIAMSQRSLWRKWKCSSLEEIILWISMAHHFLVDLKKRTDEKPL